MKTIKKGIIVARGGSRPNAGRKKGSLQKKTREVAERLTEDGVTPLEVMLTAMRGSFEVGEMQAAAAFAKEAAPYVHPKLAAINHELTGKDGGPIETVDLSPLEAARRIAFALAKGEREKG